MDEARIGLMFAKKEYRFPMDCRFLLKVANQVQKQKDERSLELFTDIVRHLND